jgi:hypothetical protein
MAGVLGTVQGPSSYFDHGLEYQTIIGEERIEAKQVHCEIG